MNIYNEKPTLKQILTAIISKEDFYSKHISNIDKKYFLENFEFIKIHKGRVNEIAFIKKK